MEAKTDLRGMPAKKTLLMIIGVVHQVRGYWLEYEDSKSKHDLSVIESSSLSDQIDFLILPHRQVLEMAKPMATL